VKREAEVEFSGYRRADGSVGARNYLAVIPTVNCMNEAAVRIAASRPGAVALPHVGRCAYLGADQTRLRDTLAGLGRNPNVGAALVVGLGCEASTAESIAGQIAATGKPTELRTVEKEGDMGRLVEEATRTLSRLEPLVSAAKREKAPLSELTLAIKCGGSDTTSGLSSNIVAGLIADRLIDAGGTVVFTETAEVLGAEHLLAARAADPRVGERVVEMVAAKEQAIKAMGVDLRRCEPTPGNILGGLTTIEEKALGAIVKAGSWPLMGALEWGEKPQGKGLYFMDGPSHTSEICAGEASAGAQIMIFSLGGGLPSMLPMTPAQSARFPIMPVMKLVGNPPGFAAKKDIVDTYVGSIIEGTESAEQAAERAFADLLDFLSGRRQTVCERYTDYSEPLNLYVTGPLV